MKKFPITFTICLTFILLIACGNPQKKESTIVSEDTVGQVDTIQDNVKSIVFFGNSLTAGYGLESTDLAFPNLIQKKIDSLGLGYRAVNAGLSGETSAGGKDRIDWLLKEPIAVFVLELGANDGLRGIPPESTYKNLGEIVDKVRKVNPDCKFILAGMMVPPSMGETYFEEFKAIFPKLAKEKDMTLVPFLLEGVAGIQKLNQKDAIHPTAEGQFILADNVWAHLKGLL